MKTSTTIWALLVCVFFHCVTATAVVEEEKFEIQAGATDGSDATCPTHDRKGNKRYHLETSKKLNWFDALNDCQRQNRRLATVTCKEQNDQIIELIEEAFPGAPSETSFWVGGTDIAKEGSWVWNATGKPIEGYTNWHDGEPNNYLGPEYCHENPSTSKGNEHCLDYWKSNNEFKWNDNRCCREFFFICEDIQHY